MNRMIVVFTVVYLYHERIFCLSVLFRHVTSCLYVASINNQFIFIPVKLYHLFLFYHCLYIISFLANIHEYKVADYFSLLICTK